jgi:hypothetical protein
MRMRRISVVLLAVLWSIVLWAGTEGIIDKLRNVDNAKGGLLMIVKNIIIEDLPIKVQCNYMMSGLDNTIDTVLIKDHILISTFLGIYSRNPVLSELWTCSTLPDGIAKTFRQSLTKRDIVTGTLYSDTIRRSDSAVLYLISNKITKEIVTSQFVNFVDVLGIAQRAVNYYEVTYPYIGAQLSTFLVSDHRQLASLNYSVYHNQNDSGHLKNFLFLFPAAVSLALGAIMVGYGLYCCPTVRGVLIILLAGIPISAAVWCFFFWVLGI